MVKFGLPCDIFRLSAVDEAEATATAAALPTFASYCIVSGNLIPVTTDKTAFTFNGFGVAMFTLVECDESLILLLTLLLLLLLLLPLSLVMPLLPLLLVPLLSSYVGYSYFGGSLITTGLRRFNVLLNSACNKSWVCFFNLSLGDNNSYVVRRRARERERKETTKENKQKPMIKKYSMPFN